MALSFPNLSRSYDADRRRIRFWAYDRAMEIPLFLKEGALLKLNADVGSGETEMLKTFDAHRDRINAAADKIHSFDRQSFYVLDANDF